MVCSNGMLTGTVGSRFGAGLDDGFEGSGPLVPLGEEGRWEVEELLDSGWNGGVFIL